MCIADDAAFARELLRSIGVDLDNAWTIPHAPSAAPLRVWAIQLLLPFIEHQL
jgi:hypothetical protein